MLVGNKWEQMFGARVKQLRKARGWTQDELARRLTAAGFPTGQTTVAKMESGDRPTSVGEIATIAELFETPVGVLFDRPDDDDVAVRLPVVEARVKQLDHDRNQLREQLAARDAEHEAAVAEYQKLAAAFGLEIRVGLTADGRVD